VSSLSSLPARPPTPAGGEPCGKRHTRARTSEIGARSEREGHRHCAAHKHTFSPPFPGSALAGLPGDFERPGEGDDRVLGGVGATPPWLPGARDCEPAGPRRASPASRAGGASPSLSLSLLLLLLPLPVELMCPAMLLALRRSPAESPPKGDGDRDRDLCRGQSNGVVTAHEE